jgi:hypothetical protein
MLRRVKNGIFGSRKFSPWIALASAQLNHLMRARRSAVRVWLAPSNPSWFGSLVPIELAATKEVVAHHASGKQQKRDDQDHYE